MPLIPCPACSSDVSTEALACPRCGHPIKQSLAGSTPATEVPSERLVRDHPDDAALCPKCGSHSIQAVAVPGKTSVGKAVATELLVGTAAGVTAGSGSSGIQALCLKCGATWVPGSKEEREMRARSGQLGAEEKERAIEKRREAKRKRKAGADLGCAVMIFVLFIGVMMMMNSCPGGH